MTGTAVTTASAESFPRRSTRGIISGLTVSQTIVLGIVVGVAFVLVAATGDLAAVVRALPFLAAVAATAFVPVGGRRIVDWGPILGHYAWRRLAKQHRFERALRAPRPAGTLALPGDAAALRLYVDAPSGAAFVHDPHARTLTAIARLLHGQFLLLDGAEQQRRSLGWAQALAALSTVDGITRIQTLERTLADSGMGVTSWWKEWPAKAEEDSWAREQYEALIGASAVEAERHETLLAVTISREKAGALVRDSGGGLTGMSAVMGTAMRAAHAALQAAEVTIEQWLPPAELALLLRSTYDPAATVELEHDPRIGRDPGAAGPITVQENWDHLRSDSGFFQVWVVNSWPRIPQFAGFLRPIVLMPHVRATWSVIHEPVPTDRAAAAAHREVVAEATAWAERAKRGQIDTIIHERERAQATQHLDDIASGFAEMVFAGALTISAPTLDELRSASSRVRAAGKEAQLELRLAAGQQATLFTAAALPLGRGLG